MKCPHCQYEHRSSYFDGTDWIDQIGYEPFFQSPVQVEQPETDKYSAVRKTLYACPECGKAFIEVD